MKIGVKGVFVAACTLAAAIVSQPSHACPTLSVSSYHPSRCIGSPAFKAGNNSGQMAFTSASPQDAFCPIQQQSGDGFPRTRSVEVHGWANSGGVTIKPCVTFAPGGDASGAGGSCGTPQTAANQVYHKTVWFGGFLDSDFAYVWLAAAGVTAGSINTVFGYTYTVFEQC